MTKCVNGYITRTYKEGDETELVQLFNWVYKDYAGFVPRTPDYWRWSCLNRPDVEAEGILVVKDGEKIIGYAVVGKTGNIWEFCYDPEYDGKAIISTILMFSINYVEGAGGDSIVFNAPANNNLVRDICLNFGFAEKRHPDCMYLNVLDFPQFIYEILNLKRKKLREINEAFLIKMRDSPSWYEKNVTVKIRNGTVTVESGVNDGLGVIVETDGQTLVSCIFGTRGLLKAFFCLRIRVKPFWKSFKIFKLFLLMKLKDPWFSPGTDFG